MNGLVFGWRTAILLIVVAQALLVAGGLWRVLQNRLANRTLATLLVVLAGVLTPWMIGFAGFYDRWRWLTFASFSISLAVAPLLWMYVQALTTGRSPKAAWRHLLPAAVQASILTLSFLLPMRLKTPWAAIALDPLSVTTSLGAAAGLAAYGAAGLSLLAPYRRALAQVRSDDARFAARWLSRALTAALLLLVVWSVYALWDAVSPLGYIRLMGLYGAIAVFTAYLSVEGWRHAALAFPVAAPAVATAPANSSAGRDWSAQGEVWAAKVRAEGWATAPDLTLAALVLQLGTNTSYLSRALNEGLGVGFSEFVNGLRSETVAEALRQGDRRDLMQIAFEASFASKASFNRAFRARFGESPSGYRRRGSDREKQAAAGDSEARGERSSSIASA